MNDKKEIQDTKEVEVVKSFLNQFSENQNHHQTLFIQFLSSVIIVLIGFAFVYSNTSGYTEYGKTHQIIDSISSRSVAYQDTIDVLRPIEARQFESIKNKNGDIISYGIIHLVIIYLFSQMVLVILCLLILHIGYSFRRDQVSVNRMRKDYLTEEIYKKYFFHFSGLNKKLLNFLPNFNSILFWGVFLIQIFIYIAMFVFFEGFDPQKKFINYFFIYDVNYYQAKISLAFPCVISPLFYIFYFIKYNKRVNNLEQYRHISIVRINNKRTLFLIGNFSFLIFATLLLIWCNNNYYSLLAGSVLTLGNAIACYISSYLQLQKEKRYKENYLSVFKLSIHGIIFLIAAAIIFLFLFIPLKWDRYTSINKDVSLVLIIIMIIVITFLSYAIKMNIFLSKLSYELKTVIRKQLGIGGYLLFGILTSTVLVNSWELWWFDRYFAGAGIGVLSFIWGVRRISTAQDLALERKKIEQV